MSNLTREELAEVISKRSPRDEVDVFMLGLDAPLEREIMRYVYCNGNIVNLQMLDVNFVYRKGLCTHKTLERRLESLVKFGFLKRFEEHGTIFYSVIKDEAKA